MSSRSLRPSRRKAGAAVLAATLGLAGLGMAASPVGASEPTDSTRVAGTTRYGTAVEISEATFGTSDDVVLARGDVYADALAGNGLAGELGAPILLTQSDTLTAETAAEIADLGAENVWIMGGTAAISQSVEDTLDATYNVVRVEGATRIQTAVDAANTIEELGSIGEVDGQTTAILVNGFNFPDAVSASPAAFAGSHPVLLTDPTDLSDDTADAIESLGIERIAIVGGTAAVSQAIETEVAGMVDTVQRFAGATRYETATDFAADFLNAELGWNGPEYDLATGEDFADALTGGPHAGTIQAPILLTPTASLAAATQTFLTTNCQAFDDQFVLGGTAAVSDATAAAAATAAQCGTSPSIATSRPELAAASIVSTTTPGQATVTNPAGTVVAYTFDEPVVAVGGAGAFHVYNASGARTDSAAGFASISSQDNKTVLVLYPGINSTAAAAQLTVATVDLGAATDSSGQNSPEGDAAIGTGGQATLSAGTTAGPDLISVSGFRGTTTAGVVAVDFTFDQAAFVQVGGVAPGTGFFLVGTDGRIVECSAPTEPSSGNTNPSGQNVPGGNGTTVITTTCGQYAGGGGTAVTASAANTARGVTQQGTVGTTPSATTVNGVAPVACGGVNAQAITNRCNPLQATATPDAGSADPDLVSATFTPTANPLGFDQVVYTFDENVQPLTVVTGNFDVYNNNGVELGGAGAQATQVSGNQVAVFYPFGTLANAVGANVDAGAVTAVAGLNNMNEDDEVGVSNPNASTTTPGKTAAPDLMSVALSSSTAGFVTTWRATYTFDEALGGTVTATGIAPQLFLHLADGARMMCTGAANVTIGTGLNGLTTSQVSCNNYTFVGGESGTNAGVATAAQIGASVLGTVNQPAAPAAGNLADAGGNFTPEGAELTTGGTA